jgi:3-oxoacyl-[acyl-carrier protein] reductase
LTNPLTDGSAGRYKKACMTQIASLTRLDGQVAVVTGASGGIGSAVALALAVQGASLILHSHRRMDAAQRLATEIQALGVAAVVELADLSESEQVDRFATAAWNWQDRVDVWINVAGADVLTGEAAQWSFDEKLQALWRVDVLATIELSRAVGARMKARGSGVIINIGWDQAEHGMAGDSGQMFGAIKGAVMAFTRSLAQSLAPQVRVNCLAPGWIRTAWGEQASAAWDVRARSESLRNRWGAPEDIAQAAAFLASPAADFINGQVVAVNGGFRYGAP